MLESDQMIVTDSQTRQNTKGVFKNLVIVSVKYSITTTANSKEGINDGKIWKRTCKIWTPAVT